MENFKNITELRQEISEINRQIHKLEKRYQGLRECIRILVVHYTLEKFPEWYGNAVGSIEDLYSGTVEVAIQGDDLVVSIQEFPSDMKEKSNWDFEMPVRSHRISIGKAEEYYRSLTVQIPPLM